MHDHELDEEYKKPLDLSANRLAAELQPLDHARVCALAGKDLHEIARAGRLDRGKPLS